MSQIKQYKTEKPYPDLKCDLGEGPHYNEELDEFRFLDINKNEIHFLNPAAGPSSHRVLHHPDFFIGVTADIANNTTELIFAGEHHFGIMNKRTGSYRVLRELWGSGPEAETNAKRRRMNDGNIDPQGRFWAGTMIDPRKDPAWTAATNTLSRLSPDLSLTPILHDASIPNGCSWSLDEKTMYWTDSGRFTIYAFDFDGATGAISNQRDFFVWPVQDGSQGPDGHAMDEEGYLWVAIFGAGKVVRVDERGEVVAEVLVPGAGKVTCPCFVGTELWVTSIGEDGDGKYAGGLFKVDVGIRGREKYVWKGKTEA